MQSSGKKLICYTSRTSCLLNKEVHSKLHSSPRNKNICKVTYSKKCKFKPRSHVKRRGTRKNTRDGKPINSLQKISDFSSAKSQSTVKLLGKKASCLDQRGDQKTDDGAIKITNKRKRRRRRKKIVEKDEVSRLQRRARYLLIKIKMEQNLIDAYSGDGWKGQSREKIKPEKELQRAEKQILKCKLGIREAIHQLDFLSSEGSIENSVIYPDGSVLHEHIFCAKCKSREAFPDNDIILCDGTCNCAFHQKCLEPPLEKIPPGDQGWLCKFCECKMGILEAINAHLGTCFSINSSWEEIFKEATAIPIVEKVYLDPAEEWPSEDSEDEDYDPRNENNDTRTATEEHMSDDASSSSGVCLSSDEAWSYSNESINNNWNERSYLINCKSKNKSGLVHSVIGNESGETSEQEVMSFRRQRKDVDYKRLYVEMFGKDLPENEQQSEDEDWGPCRRKRRTLEADAGTTVTDCGSVAGCPNMFVTEKMSSDRKPVYRIPPYAVEKLRQVFSENELPSRAVKENLSKQLGVTSEKISKWFRNARYAALKVRKAEFNPQVHINDVTRRTKRRVRKKLVGSNEVALIEDSYMLPLSSIIRIPKRLRRNCCRKDPKSITKPLQKQQKRAANAVPPDKIQKVSDVHENQLASMSVKKNLPQELGPPYHQMSRRFTNAVYYRRQVSGSKSKLSRNKAFDVEGRTCPQVDKMTDNEQLYLTEMERLFNLEDRLQKLKKMLLASEEDDHTPNNRHSSEPIVIYVPFAEVKEKT